MASSRQKFNVFLVEDEIGVRRSLIGKINWDGLNLQLMGQAQNAEEAYEAFQVSSPDIVLLDMRMPGMGGMVFLEILNKQFPSIKIIVLSGYSNFEYAKQAIVCGASNYLLKPIIKEDLAEALKKVVHELEQTIKEKESKIEQQILLNQSKPLLKRAMLNKLLQGVHMNTNNILDKIEMLGINLNTEHYVLTILNVIDFEHLKLFYGKNMELIYFAIENVMEESISDSIHFVGFKSEFRENEYICLHGFNHKLHIRETLQNLYRNAVTNIETFNKIKVNISISRIFQDITETHKYYMETSYLWNDNKEFNIRFYDDIHSGESEMLHIWNPDKSHVLIERIKQDDKKGIVTVIQELFTDAEKQFGEATAKYKDLVAQIFRVIEENITQIKFSLREPLDYDLPLFQEWVSSFDSKEDLKYGLIQLLDEISVMFNTSNHKTKHIIQQAREYIDCCFYENLTLEMMAQKYHMNRTYFSDLFKQEIGCSFKKYLIQTRIEVAKELLAKKDMKAVNVALIVGFNDPNYFSNVFKKYTGRSITEFKNSL
ncbi:response regulator [Paenibacillus sp. FSL H7-0331]|uniref:response regulator n=1 Tax=Paenibacillus sp. FSL H7-0331 TaxID=1920421 RepID=UPI00096C1E70|nr:response regulator [Paenibacillus sp. FSL H7-0331]OMF06984.1 hypothetical protein BK127_30645 [Paenibacillus sp. FSL H7-0331]